MNIIKLIKSFNPYLRIKYIIYYKNKNLNMRYIQILKILEDFLKILRIYFKLILISKRINVRKIIQYQVQKLLLHQIKINKKNYRFKKNKQIKYLNKQKNRNQNNHNINYNLIQIK